MGTERQTYRILENWPPAVMLGKRGSVLLLFSSSSDAPIGRWRLARGVWDIGNCGVRKLAVLLSFYTGERAPLRELKGDGAAIPV